MPRKTSVVPKTVLCLGLEGADRSRLPGHLRRFGYLPVAVSLDQALAASLPEGEVRLVILDLSRSPERGIEVLRSLRSHAGARDLPVLLLAPVAGMGFLPRAIEAGGDDYLLKPLDPRLLFTRVQQLAEVNPRMHCRVACEVPLELLARGEHFSGEVMEVGEGGLRAVLPRKMAPGELALLRFHLPRQKEQLAAAAMCVFCRKVASGHSLGFQFVLIEQAHLSRIRRFILKSGDGKVCPPPPPGHRMGRA